jgi:hypothetical protein
VLTGFAKDDPKIRDATLTALLGGGVTGGILGGASGLFGEVSGAAKAAGPKAVRNAILKSIGTKAALGALASGALAGGSAYIGNKAMGVPDDADPTGYTTRGAVGGAIGGGVGGAGIGALAARGKIPLPKKSPDLLRAYAQKLKAMPLSKGAGIGAALGALGLGSLAAYQGADEGMQLDFLNNQMEAEKRKKMREEHGY